MRGTRAKMAVKLLNILKDLSGMSIETNSVNVAMRVGLNKGHNRH